MLTVISVSLGSSSRDHSTQTTMLGKPIALQRIGLDGDLGAMRAFLVAHDGQVDAFGIGGADLGIRVNQRFYPLRSVQALIRGLQTPAVDGEGIRRLVEGNFAARLETLLPIPIAPRRVLIGTAVARYDLARSFVDAGYEILCGDLGFEVGLPIPLRSLGALERVGRIAIPAISRLPFSWLYPTGDEQETIQPKFGHWYAWATVIADDWHLLKKHLPDRLDGKIVVTNTTTEADVTLLRARGAAFLVTTTPRFEGRTFGTNVMEAALTALAGHGRPLTEAELQRMVAEVDFTPFVLDLRS